MREQPTEQPIEQAFTESLLGELERVMGALRARTHVVDSVVLETDRHGTYRLSIVLLAVDTAEGSGGVSRARHGNRHIGAAHVVWEQDA